MAAIVKNDIAAIDDPDLTVSQKDIVEVKIIMVPMINEDRRLQANRIRGRFLRNPGCCSCRSLRIRADIMQSQNGHIGL
jgi:hypothetical protein